MKLIFCTQCNDLVELARTKRFCICQSSWGYYRDSIHAVFAGPCVPIGIENRSFFNAIQNRTSTASVEFKAFVIPEPCDTFSRIGQ